MDARSLALSAGVNGPLLRIMVGLTSPYSWSTCADGIFPTYDHPGAGRKNLRPRRSEIFPDSYQARQGPGRGLTK